MNWYRIAQSDAKMRHSRVKKKDYFQLMRELNQGSRNLPLLNKMIYDLEPAIMTIWMNTVAMGHTASGYAYPCPNCNSGDMRWDDYDSIYMMEHYDSIDAVNDEEDKAMLQPYFEQDQYGDGLFMCPHCINVMTFQQVSDAIDDPTGVTYHSRGSLFSDQIERIWDIFRKAQEGETFEDKFHWFEAIIQYVHGSGGISHFFIEGGEDTINSFRGGEVI